MLVWATIVIKHIFKQVLARKWFGYTEVGTRFFFLSFYTYLPLYRIVFKSAAWGDPPPSTPSGYTTGSIIKVM